MALETINRNLPLGAPKKNIRMGNPYLDQIKEIDAELERLDTLVRGALKGSDNKKRDLKILNAQLRRSGDLNRNRLGIGKAFWSRRDLPSQMRALKARRDKLTNFLGKEYINVGDQNMPKIKGFTPTFEADLDNKGRKINMYYNPYFNTAKRKKDQGIYDSLRSDILGGTDSTVSTGALEKLIQDQLPEGNMYRKDSKFYIGNVDEYGQSKRTTVTSEEKDGGAVTATEAAQVVAKKDGGSTWEGNTLKGGGGLVGRGTDVRMSDGGSTSLSIAARDWGKYKKGDTLGVMSRNERRRYNKEVLEIG